MDVKSMIKLSPIYALLGFYKVFISNDKVPGHYNKLNIYGWNCFFVGYCLWIQSFPLKLFGWSLLDNALYLAF